MKLYGVSYRLSFTYYSISTEARSAATFSNLCVVGGYGSSGQVLIRIFLAILRYFPAPQLGIVCSNTWEVTIRIAGSGAVISAGMSGILSTCIDALKAADWSAVASSLSAIVRTVWVYWFTLYGFIFNHARYEDCDSYKDDKWARVQVFSLALIFKLWSLKHYRSQSFQQDMIDNLRNVAIPGTGVPLSVFCYSYWTCLAYVMVVNPLICLAGAVNKSRKEKFTTVEAFVASVKAHFTQHLLHPDDWFSFWRLNCRLVSYHSALSSHPDYLQEDKWTFLVDGKAAGVPVSPFIDSIGSLVCKNKNVEGGMGIHFFRNAAHGGDWILQERLENADWLNTLLPANAPLSTMRVITTSTWALGDRSDGQGQGHRYELGEGGVLGAQPGPGQVAADFVRAESGVLRLGRANASTDHSSVLFDVDIATGVIREGTSNAHWYQLGPRKALACPWLPPAERVTRHADAPFPEVTGRSIPRLGEALKIVTE